MVSEIKAADGLEEGEGVTHDELVQELRNVVAALEPAFRELNSFFQAAPGEVPPLPAVALAEHYLREIRRRLDDSADSDRAVAGEHPDRDTLPGGTLS